MDTHTLPLESKKILEECPRLRILVVGKSGVGKSSLIYSTFGVDMASVSHDAPGVCDINTEITSTQNSLFVVHDSMGFEPGQTENFEIVKHFLESRSGDKVPVKDRVHVIWHCIQVPHAGGRTSETGDENFLKLASVQKVPVVVVFTQFDMLVERMEQDLLEKMTPDEDIDRLALEKADSEFHRLCLEPLRKASPGVRYARTTGLADRSLSRSSRRSLMHLIQITRELVEENVDGDVWIVSVMAQRANALEKINGSIEIGLKRYWQNLASAASFGNSTLETCLATIHEEITESWNFYDPSDLLNGKEFRDRIKAFVQLVTPGKSEVRSWFENLENIETLVGLGTALASVMAPAIAGIALSVVFIRWLTNAYRKTPEVLRCLMGYIIDLTLVMDQLFLIVLAIRPPRALTVDDIDLALEEYKRLDLGNVHREVRLYANKATFAQILQANNAEQKVKELIQRFRVKS
ncbi:hypothetical protein GGX14DRAFT_443367 [Mycena pura]|uniref:G domain-containing protein n=1 Tax=Mycena pura TaxID=153505 RepID=A0AAD6VMX1_9AGAR|nr:hypothetical protein GGX14DRAFT_443367 [Mycena pura]